MDSGTAGGDKRTTEMAHLHGAAQTGGAEFISAFERLVSWTQIWAEDAYWNTDKQNFSGLEKRSTTSTWKNLELPSMASEQFSPPIPLHYRALDLPDPVCRSTFLLI